VHEDRLQHDRPRLLSEPDECGFTGQEGRKEAALQAGAESAEPQRRQEHHGTPEESRQSPADRALGDGPGSRLDKRMPARYEREGKPAGTGSQAAR